MLMSNVIEGADKRSIGSSMSPIAKDATAARVLCAHEAIKKSFKDAKDAIAASAGQLDLSWTSWRRSGSCSATLSAAACQPPRGTNAATSRPGRSGRPPRPRLAAGCNARAQPMCGWVWGACRESKGSRPSTEALVGVCV